jgi:AraC-like DNA-binding protein
LSAGDILLIRSGTLHGSDPTTCIYESLDFDLYGLFRKLDMVKSYLRPFYRLLSVPQCYFTALEYPELAAIVDNLMFAFSADRENACQELETIAYISSLFAWIINHNCYQKAPENEEFSSRKIDVIKAVLEYIESNYSTNISLNSMAHIAGMNPKYFCRVFRSLTHHSPIDYLNFYRVEQAAHLLDTMDISVTSVGAECGFSESSYFTKVFRKYKGVTPKEYRQMVLGHKNTI